jgi:hypothetical protein
MSDNPPSKDLLLEWVIPSDLDTKFANNFIIQNNGDEIIISFFEVIPPILVGDSKMIEDSLTKLTTVPAKCVSRIVITRQNLEILIRVLTDHHERITKK